MPCFLSVIIYCWAVRVSGMHISGEEAAVINIAIGAGLAWGASAVNQRRVRRDALASVRREAYATFILALDHLERAWTAPETLENEYGSWNKGHPLAVRCGRQIAEDQRVRSDRVLSLKLCDQVILQAADPRLVNRARVMGHQPGQAIIGAGTPQEPGAIQGMKTRLHQLRAITNVVQPRSRGQVLIRQTQPRSDFLTASTNPLNMPPAARQSRAQVPFRQSTSLSDRHHGPERTFCVAELSRI